MTIERTLAVVGAFALAVLIGLGVYHWATSGPAEPVEAVPRVAAASEEPAKPSAPEPLLHRNVFDAPSALERPVRDFAQSDAEEEQPRSAPTRSVAQRPLVGSVPPVIPMLLPPPIGSGPGWQQQQPEPESEPEEPEKIMPPEAGLIVTATVRGPEGMRALVEDKATGLSQWVTQGEVAFGYSISRITERGGLAEKHGRAYVLQTGSGKPVQPVLSAPKPESKEGGSEPASEGVAPSEEASPAPSEKEPG